MADQEAYKAAMTEAANAAWEHDWATAIAAYQRAIQIIPGDAQALAGLAASLMESGQYDQALQTYERVSQIVPSDPLPLEKIAEIYYMTGRIPEAARRYFAVAEIYFSRRDLRQAVANWERATGLDADALQAHMRLAQYYEQNPESRSLAVYEYLALARLLQKASQLSKAEQALTRALNLETTNMDARAALDDFKRGVPLQTVVAPGRPAPPPPPTRTGRDGGPAEPEPEVTQRSLADEAAHSALAVLADLPFSGDVPPAAIEPLVQAIELHQIGAADEAIQSYNAAIQAGLNHPALTFNLGLMYHYTNQPDQALNLLPLAADNPQYGPAASMMLGQIYYARQDATKAAEYFVAALRGADMLVNDRVDNAGYGRLMAGLADQTVEYHSDLCKGLSAFLNDVKWRDRLKAALAGYITAGKTSYVPDLVEIVLEGGRPEIGNIMERVDLYVSRNLHRMALEELYYAVEKSPDYLPAHRRLADILIKEGRTQDAALKINLVADTYLVRGEKEKAADLFAEVIDLWPSDVAARDKVITMLKEQGRVNEALHHYTEMGDFYLRLMADIPKATEFYHQALDYARKNNADPSGIVRILKALADIEGQQLNTRKALSYYEQVIQMAPDDEEATLAVIDLNFQSGESDAAVAALDNYIRYCITAGKTDKIVTTLEEQSRNHPNEVGVRQRLAQVYQQQKRIPDAIAQMDAIGELLLDSGRVAEAAEVIRSIIALNPPDIEGYQQLLAQLEAPPG